MSHDALERYKEYMDNCMSGYYSDEEILGYFGRLPKLRYDTFKYCWDHFLKNKFQLIVEMGTSRSFVDGKYPGCNEDDSKYWQPENPDVWDWSAGCFTRVFGELIQGTDTELISIDLEARHIARSRTMVQGLDNIEYYHMSSEEFLESGEGQIDFLYIDTGDMTPIEYTAQLQLREAKIIVERDLIKENGIVLIDDVRNVQAQRQDEKSEYGKAKYSIPYFLENGFYIAMDEYQVVLRKE